MNYRAHDLKREDFAPLEKSQLDEVVARPSLSYWQDAWRRFKQNTRAIISMYILIALAVFTLGGPLLWTVDASKQNLNQTSQPPGLAKHALVVSAFERWTLPTDPSRPEYGDLPPEELANPEGLRAAEAPNTQSVRITWRPVAEAGGYNIYRHTRPPTSLQDLGLPLGSIETGNVHGYEDRLNLKQEDYFYSVVATDGFDEAETYATLQLRPQLAITREHALEQGLSEDPRAGDTVTLAFYPLGTDYLGRDMLARLMEGARVSLFIGVIAPLAFVIFGVAYGGFSGYIGGTFDNILMRLADFVVALPFLLFMILFKIAFGIGPGESGVIPMLVALVLLSWPATARLVRGQVLQIREQGYIDAARLMGASNHYLIARHILPNTMGVVLVTFTFAVPMAIFAEAFLSFIGMGVAPPTPSWGSMCNEGVKTMLSHPHELILPAALISITVLAFNLFGDGLTEALDARMRGRE